METIKWWQKAVIYQIYPRSFLDTDGDGIGDIPGIIRKLDYVQSLGVDAIWLSPVFKSPQDDNGYDISDYQDIDPLFGSLDDMMTLISEAKQRNIRIILDMVLNHTSDEHPWFQESRQSRNNPKHDWYVWRDGVPGTPPNALRSSFGGSAWQWCEERGQYYLHQYSVKQPDLNWDNPAVRQALYDMMRWWADQGAGGFRLDVIDSIAKDPDKMIIVETPNLHPYIREMSAAVLQGTDLVTVGEVWSANPERAKLWSNPDGSELSMVFQFEHILMDQQDGKDKWDLCPMSVLKLKKISEKWHRELSGTGWNSQFWENHDLPRIVSRWGNDGEYREASAKMLGMLLMGFQGTPYIYQGQELGMTSAPYALEEYRDIEIHNMARERLAAGYSMTSIMESIHKKCRDNARTPMQWTAGENAGFTEGDPWLKVNPNHVSINVAEEETRGDSVLNFYRKAVALRKSDDVFFDGSYETLLPDHPEVFAYRRENRTTVLTVVTNFSDQENALPQNFLAALGEPALCTYPDAPVGDVLRPWEGRMFLKRK